MIATLFLWVAAALAADLQLVVDSPKLVVGQSVGLNLQLVGATASGLPEVPVSSGLKLAFAGQSQQMVSVNFQTTRTVTYSFSLTALQEGRFTVGPVRMQVGGQELVADAVTIEVTGRAEPMRADLDVVGALSDPAPYVGEVVTWVMRFRSKAEVSGLSWNPPEFDGFLQEKTVEVGQSSSTVEADGAAWQLQEVTVPLIATGVGAHTISPALLTVSVPDSGRPRRDRLGFGFQPTRQERLTTAAVEVNIRPLPTEGRPADYSGLVGTFALQARALPGPVKVGDSVSVDVVLSGNGSLSGVKLPAAPADASYRVYDDAPQLQSRLGPDGFVSSARFKRAIVPTAEGRLTIPPLRLSVFDPDAGAYVTLESEPIELDVAPGDGGGAVTSYASGGDQRAEVASTGSDILPASADAAIGDDRPQSALPGALALVVLPGLALLGQSLQSLRGRRAADPARRLRERLSSLPADASARLAALEDLTREAAALRLGRPAPGLDAEAITPLGEAARTLYADLLAARYGGGQIDDLERRVRTFVEETR